ncbi:MAG: hypothetical protein OXM55_06725 [Bdellovibrionales bacterium]|nr:hypothetical protein [Bdellovibrionales bacterium]
MNISIKYAIPLLLLFACLLSGTSYYVLNHWLIVSEIQLEMQKEPVWEGSMEEIRSLMESRLQPFIGKKIWKISDELIKSIQLEPRVGSVKILRLLPNRLFIYVQPRKPMLVLLHPSSGKIHPLSMNGEILPPLPSKQIPNLPILRGTSFLKKKEIRKSVIQFFHLMPKQGEFSREAISEVKYSTQDNSLIFILSKNGKSIRVGYNPVKSQIRGVASVKSEKIPIEEFKKQKEILHKINIKTKRIESVLRYLDQKNIKWRVIDARFSQKIVVSTSKAI